MNFFSSIDLIVKVSSLWNFNIDPIFRISHVQSTGIQASLLFKTSSQTVVMYLRWDWDINKVTSLAVAILWSKLIVDLNSIVLGSVDWLTNLWKDNADC